MFLAENKILVFPNHLIIKGNTNTNFIFKVDNYINEDKANKKFPSIKQLLKDINSKGGRIEFIRIEDKIYNGNLVMIDGLLPRILAEIILTYYQSENFTFESLVEKLEKQNTLNHEVEYAQQFYKYKIKMFLLESMLGMNCLDIWSGSNFTSREHYVKDRNGNIFYYNIYNRTEFANYLFLNTRLDQACSIKYKFGTLYKDPVDDNYYLKLNLQIRFK